MPLHDGPEASAQVNRRHGGADGDRQGCVEGAPVSSILNEVYPAFVIHVDHADEQVVVVAATGDSPGFYAAHRFVDKLRAGPGNRAITPELLKSVADGYRRNIDCAPTQAVARTFGVESRMASNYVDRARRAGYLPPTKQGKKKA